MTPKTSPTTLYDLDEYGSLERLNLHAGQTRAWDSQARFVFIIAGTQSGKTSFGPWWLRREIYGDYHGFAGRGGGDYIAATSTFDLFKLKMLPEILHVFEDILKIGRYWAGDKVLELRDPETHRFWARRAQDQMWGRVILRSAASRGGLESATAKGAWLDEVGQDDFPVDAWEAILRRLSLAEGRVLGTTTPYNLGWLKQQVYDQWVMGDDSYDVIQFPSTLNPLFPRREYKAAKKRMPRWKYLMFYRGQFTRPPGLIYSDYDDEADGNRVEDFIIPSHWPRYVGVDPGGVNLATIWIAMEPSTGTYYVYRETLEGDLTTRGHTDAAKQRSVGERVIVWCGGAPSEDQTRRDWTECGILLEKPPVAAVWPGIDRVAELFKTKKLFVFTSLAGLRSELGTYSRVLNPRTLEPTTEIKDKNQYHRLDALRYVCTQLNGATWDDLDEPDKTASAWSSEEFPSAWGETLR